MCLGKVPGKLNSASSCLASLFLDVEVDTGCFIVGVYVPRILGDLGSPLMTATGAMSLQRFIL